ncbi:hypothetical protein COZ40_02185 [Candidatus Roizmanbacteria bacterium CG_4_10_14_3_um_filter_39_13]|uniref:Uncharacterized protein n=3 Tax=Candidatus Roizmaniibacteriota TaxID=1752723 RepID=A0A2M7LKP7_9BACT|nr:MAG: hypothetical protein COZ40_02185 [Candidatus Roizmanbacteria bacterium CG_4_10_14_3_um_filter_39_13]
MFLVNDGYIRISHTYYPDMILYKCLKLWAFELRLVDKVDFCLRKTSEDDSNIGESFLISLAGCTGVSEKPIISDYYIALENEI